MTTQAIEAIIRKYNLAATGDGNIAIRETRNITQADIATIKAAKAEILEHMAVIAREKEETAAHTVCFWVSGWEAHEVAIDDRKDLDAQFDSIAAMYASDSITVEIVRDSYNKHIGNKAAAVAKDIAALEALIADNECKPLMTDAENQVWRKRHNDLYNEGGDGYVPNNITKEDVQRAKIRLAQLMTLKGGQP